jgi:hypothetical protein
VRLLVVLISVVLVSSCGIYSFRGGQYSGAKTFSVDFFKPQTALATQVYAQNFTENLKDLMLAQSPLTLVTREGDLQYEGSITGYVVAPVAIQGNETASLNRLTITIKVKYTNTIEKNLSFERSFSKYADFEADVDLFSVEETLWAQINDQLAQEVYNASVGNW